MNESFTNSKMCKGLFPPKELGPQESQNHATSHNGGKEGERFNDDLPQTSTTMISDIRSKTMARSKSWK